MSMSSSESSEPEPQTEEAEPEAVAEPALPLEGPTIITRISYNGIEPPSSLSETAAQALWSALTAPWHPAVLAALVGVPRVESTDAYLTIASQTLQIMPPGGVEGQGWGEGDVIESDADRRSLVATLVARYKTRENAVCGPNDETSALVPDFLALGAAHFWLRELTSGMGHAETLDTANFAKETLAAARAWVADDTSTAKNRLRAAFELLTEARERYYPVDSYLVDLCLLDPAMSGGVLGDSLDSRTPFTILGSARAIENQASKDAEGIARLREAISEGWADVAGGTYDETEEPLRPLETILWQFRRGAEVYREHLDQRSVESLARRRFALYPMLPQIGKRFGLKFAIHLGFDAGRFPIRPESKRLWESPDHTNLESLTRPPIAADRALSGLSLPWRMAVSMKDDHVATVPMVRWAAPALGWFADLRRVAAYSPVIGRCVTLNDFFHLTDRPYETFSPEPDEYVTPYLSQAVARKDPKPISFKAEHARLRAKVDALSTLASLAEALGVGVTGSPGATGSPEPVPEGPQPADTGSGEPVAPNGSPSDLTAAEMLLETSQLDAAAQRIDTLSPEMAESVAKGVLKSAPSGRPGYLVLNPTGVARRAAVILPDAAMDLRPEGPLRAAQFTEEGVQAIVEVPAFGFSWVPRAANLEAARAPSGKVSAKDKVLKNEAMAVEIDPATGGLRGVHASNEETPRLGQQLAIGGLVGPDGKAVASRMRGTSFEVEYAGPALVQAVSTGQILGPGDKPLMTFRQRFRLWNGRPELEIAITLSDIDEAWLASIADADPWVHYLACRWAWPDSNSMLRRTCLLSAELTEAQRPETPDALDISTRRQRTALLFGGLAHHKRHGARMLDTLLIAGRETARSFAVGVALELEHPFQAAIDFIAPSYVVPTDQGPPNAAATGWLYHIDHKSVAVTRVEYVPATEDGRGWGLVFHLLETAGRSARCRLRTFRNPSWGRQTDFQGEVLVDLPTDNDAVLVDLTPHELARVEVTLG
jgi:alpha-mannosidase